MAADDAGQRDFLATQHHSEFPIELIRLGKRLRPVNPGRVGNLRVSMRENGFIGSITIRPVATDYELVVGAHRLTAWTEEGGLTIPVQIRHLTDDEALQIEIDENLVDEGLSPLERAEMIAARFEVWRRRFPDRVVADDEQAAPKRGRPQNSVSVSQLTGGAPETMGFAVSTAQQLGLSKRTVERSFSVVRGLPADLRSKLHGTPLAASEGLLRQLASVGDHAEQDKIADVLIQGATKNFSDARALAAGNAPVRPIQTPVDETLKAFRKLWGAASASGRAAILDDLAGRSLPKGWAVSATDLRETRKEVAAQAQENGGDARG